MLQGGGRQVLEAFRRAPMRYRLAGVLLAVLAAGAMVVPPLSAAGLLQPLNDLLSLGHAGGQKPAEAPVQRNAEPPTVATPRAKCLPGSRQEPGIQGRVPNGAGSRGLHCNVDLLSHQGVSGGFKVHRYIDRSGHECGFYDTALLFPTNALKLDGTSQGVAVLDMSNPARPKQTATLRDIPMNSPHESLALNPRRGLLAAVMGNPNTAPGLVSIYDVRSDCRHPKLQSTRPVARLGHESGFSQDGRTFYAAATGLNAVSAIDVTDPRNPHSIWLGEVASHGLSLSRDGNRAYIADANGGNLTILDTSEIQARRSNPQARQISRLTWDKASIPQNAIPFTVKGKPYLIETDEYTQGTTGNGDRDAVGAARIIDISDERRPRVVSNLRLQVHQPADHKAAESDPGANSPVQGYAGHYCDVPTSVDPKVVACSFIVSGLRVFDISTLTRPKEIAYHVAPTRPRFENGYMASAFAMSKPAFAPRRREVWYSDGATGFNVVRVRPEVWPGAGRECLPRRMRVGRKRIGPVRLGMSKRTLRRRVAAPVRSNRRAYRWCVRGSRGKVTATFDRRGRVTLVASTSGRQSVRRVRPGSRARRLRRAFRRRKTIIRGVVRAHRRSRVLFGARRGRVAYVGVSSRGLLRNGRAMKRHLRYAGVVRARRR